MLVLNTLNNLAGLHKFHPSTFHLYLYRLRATYPCQLYHRSVPIFVPDCQYRLDDDECTHLDMELRYFGHVHCDRRAGHSRLERSIKPFTVGLILCS
jgi:hypothetical protein